MFKLITPKFILLGLYTLVSSVTAEVAEEIKPYGPELFEVEDTSTKVKVFAFIKADVKLSVKGLTLKDGFLKGYYFLTVPMKDSKNEMGIISLELDKSPEKYIQHGGKMDGTGTCLAGDGRPLRILEAKIVPNKDNCYRGKLHLQVDTTERVLNFVSDYTIDRKMLAEIDSIEVALINNEVVVDDSNL